MSTWTYNPVVTPRDEIRFLTRDTDQSKDWTLNDQEIDYLISLWSPQPATIGNQYLTAAKACEEILAAFKGNIQTGKRLRDLQISYSPDAVKFYENRLISLKASAALKQVGTYVGGASKSDKFTLDSDPDRVQPAFKVNGMDKTTSDPAVDPTLGLP